MAGPPRAALLGRCDGATIAENERVNKQNEGLGRHCERSEAIHRAAYRIDGLLRRYAPRNDAGGVTPAPLAQYSARPRLSVPPPPPADSRRGPAAAPNSPRHWA